MRQISTSIILAGTLVLAAGGALADSNTGTAAPQQARTLLDYHSGGEVSPEQMRLYGDAVFVKYDTDGDGYLSDEEWVVRSKAEIEAEGSDVVIFDDHALEAVDRDGDGRISHDEWSSEVDGYFGSLDLNNNGIVDEEELDAGRKPM